MIGIDIIRKKRNASGTGDGSVGFGVSTPSGGDAQNAVHADDADHANRADEAAHAQSAKELDGTSSVWGKIRSLLSDLSGVFLRKDQDDATDHKLTMGEAEVKGNATVGGNSTVGGTAHVTGQAIVDGGAVVGTGATVLGNAAIGGSLLVSGEANFYDVSGLKKGATFGDGTYSVDENGLARLAGAVAAYLKSGDYSKGTAQGFDGRGYGITKDGNGKYTLEIDNLVARMKMIVAMLEVHEMSFIGGTAVLSACGNRVDRVEALDAGGKPIATADGTKPTLTIPSGKTAEKFRCYFLASDGDRQIKNEWAVGQLARAKTNNIAAPGSYKDYQNRDYWRLVVGVSSAPVTIEGKEYHYIDLSNSTGKVGTLTDAAGTTHPVELGGVSETLNSLPFAGDNIIGMGHCWDGTRQGVAIISVVQSGWVIYKGIDHYDLPEENIVNKFSIDETIVTTDHFTMRPYAEPDNDAVALCDRGGYSDDRHYGRGDLVTWDGQVWKCSVARGERVSGERPSAGSAYWQLYVMKGADLAVMYMALGDVLADEDQSFTLTAQTLVAFGAGDKWVFQTIKAGNYVANLTLFHNMDPIPNVKKQAVKVTWSESVIEDAMWRAEKIGGTPGVVTSNTDWTIRRIERAQGTWVRYSDGTGFSGMEGESEGNAAAADSWYKRAISGRNMSAPDKMWSSGPDAWSAKQQDGVTVALNVRRTPNGYRGVQFRIGGGNAPTRETTMEYNGFGKVAARRMYLLHVFANHSTQTGSDTVAFSLDFYRPDGTKAGSKDLGYDSMTNGGYALHPKGDFWFVFDPSEVVDAFGLQVRLVVRVTASVNTTICPAGLWDVTAIGNPMGTVKTALMGVAVGSWGAAPVGYGLYEWQVVKGDKGDKGDTGAPGPKGETGDTGAPGPKGETGDTGAAAVSYRLVRMADTSATVRVSGSQYGLAYVLHYKAMRIVGGSESAIVISTIKATIEGVTRSGKVDATEGLMSGDSGGKAYTATDRPQDTIPVEVNVKDGPTLYDTVPVTIEAGVAIDINQEIGELKITAAGQGKDISSLKVKADEISTTVSDQGGQISDILQRADQILLKVGALGLRNLLMDSEFRCPVERAITRNGKRYREAWNNGTAVSVTDTANGIGADGVNAVKAFSPSADGYWTVTRWYVPAKPGQDYTASVWRMVPDTGTLASDSRIILELHACKDDLTRDDSYKAGSAFDSPSPGTWARTAATLTMPEDTAHPYIEVALAAYKCGTVYFRQPQLEYGSEATEWTRSPEDVEGGLLATGVDIESGKITLTADNVTVRNNSGGTTAMLDANGKLRTEMIDTDTLVASAMYTSEDGGYTEIHDSTTIWYGADGLPGIQVFYDETGVPHLQFMMRTTDSNGDVIPKPIYDLGPSGIKCLLDGVRNAYTEDVTLWGEYGETFPDHIITSTTSGATYHKFHKTVYPIEQQDDDAKYDGRVMQVDITKITGNATEDKYGCLWYNNTIVFIADGWWGMEKPWSMTDGIGNTYWHQTLGYYKGGLLLEKKLF